VPHSAYFFELIVRVSALIFNVNNGFRLPFLIPRILFGGSYNNKNPNIVLIIADEFGRER